MKQILSFIAIFLFTACDNGFLNETIVDELAMKTANSSIILSPDWEVSNYSFSCQVNRHAEYTIDDAPDWLELQSTSGMLQFVPADPNIPGSTSGGVGVIRAKAKNTKAFTKMGVYLEYLIVNVKGVGKFRIPVYYLNGGNPTIQIDKTLFSTYDSYSPIELPIYNTGEGILYWELLSMPEWMSINYARIMEETIALVPQQERRVLPLMLNVDKLEATGIINGELVLRTNDKQQSNIIVQVTIDMGEPVLQLSGLTQNKVIDFGHTYSTYSLFMMNQGNGMLIWKFTDLPEWLSIDQPTGNMRSYNAATIMFNVDAGKMVPGLNTADIKLHTNDPQSTEITIKVIARGPGNAANILPVQGNIIDAAIDKTTNILYYVISQPNKLIGFDVKTKNIVCEINLTNAPTCVEFNEDFSQAAVGHGGLISIVDVISKTVIKTITLTNSVNDIAWVSPTTLCYTELAYNSKNTYWIDLSYYTLSVVQNNSVDGKTIVKKIPGQPYLLATRQQSSPSGIITINATERKVHSYSHKSLNDFWFVKSGEYFIARGGDVYRTSAVIPDVPNEYIEINPVSKLTNNNNETFVTHWTDYSAPTNQLFTVNYNIYTPNYIYQFEANDYKLVRTYTYDKMYQEGSVPVFTEVEARYVFANREGTELTVLRKGKNNSVWSMEFIVVNN